LTSNMLFENFVAALIKDYHFITKPDSASPRLPPKRRDRLYPTEIVKRTDSKVSTWFALRGYRAQFVKLISPFQGCYIINSTRLRSPMVRLWAVIALLLIWLILPMHGYCQKPFAEGTIVYKVRLTDPNGNDYQGKCTYTFKNTHMRKDLSVAGYQETQILNSASNTAYSLKSQRNKRYAIRLDTSDLRESQLKYAGFQLVEQTGRNKKIAGLDAVYAKVIYKDSSETGVYFTRSWYPVFGMAFEGYPDVRFLPLAFTNRDSTGYSMEYVADQVLPAPVENGIFMIPRDYKVISYDEFKKVK